MEDQVPFKAFVFWNEKDKPEVRRFGMARPFVTQFNYLTARLQGVYPNLEGKIFSVTWKDEDGDDVSISSNEELMVALTAQQPPIFKLYVQVKDDSPKEDDCEVIFTAVPETTSGLNAVHLGVICDGCDTQVQGFRYKCTSCVDFDLCSRCESNGMHAEHCMVRLPAPIMPREVIKAAIKRSRHILKNIPGRVGECPYKKNKRERSGDRKHREHHHGHHGERQRGDCGDRSRRPRSSWLETFATYMNEFANLAGDFDPKVDLNKKSKQQEQAEGSTQEQQGEAAKESNTEAKNNEAEKPEAGSTTTQTPPTQCPFTPENMKNFSIENVLKVLEMHLGAYTNIPKPSTSTADDDVDMSQNNNTEPDTSKAPDSDVSEVPPANNLVNRDASPDKADGGWTLINNDLMDATIAPPLDPKAPIGFNLPQEFQERVSIGEGNVNASQNLYPPLNTATAVLNPKELEVAAAAAVTTAQTQPTAAQQQPFVAQQQPFVAQPQPSAHQPQPFVAQPQPFVAQPQPFAAQPQPAAKPAQPQPQPRQRHPKAHVEAAIQQMLAMGFTNEGGWLTQLLESKDGNIAAVLDLLTPVNPKNK